MNQIKANNLRKAIVLASSFLDDTIALNAPELFDFWKSNINYSINDRCREPSNGFLYKCIQSHISQSDWNPAATPALWARIGEPTEEWPEWIQPIGASNSYNKNDKVSHNNKHWVSEYDANVWEPGVYGWIENN